MSIALIVGADDETATRITAAIGHRTVALRRESVIADTASLLQGLDASTLPEAIVFAETVPLKRSLEMAAEVHAVRPDIDMVLIAPAEQQIMLDAMRAGIRDVAVSLEDASFLAGLRDRLAARVEGAKGATHPGPISASEAFTSRTITVISPKGGVGKTSVSSNLAVALGQISPMEVVLVDLDLQFGDLSTVLDLQPSHTLADAFGSAARDNLMLKTYLTVHEGGFYVLCGADSPAANDKVTGEQVTQLIEQLQAQFRYVVIDTAAGLDDATVAAVECSDDAIVVSTMDVACLRSVRKELELLKELGILPATSTVVLNFADKQSGLTVKDVEAVLGVPVDVVLPRTKEAPMASNRGVPLLLSAKSSGFAKRIRSLGRRVADQGRVDDQPAGRRRRLGIVA